MKPLIFNKETERKSISLEKLPNFMFIDYINYSELFKVINIDFCSYGDGIGYYFTYSVDFRDYLHSYLYKFMNKIISKQDFIDNFLPYFEKQ